MSRTSFKLMERLSRLPPARRLAVNMKAMLDRMAQAEVCDVFRDGLDEKEQTALIELQVKDASPRMKEIAHGLLCIDERSAFVQSMGSMFKNLVTRKGGYIQNGSA